MDEVRDYEFAIASQYCDPILLLGEALYCQGVAHGSQLVDNIPGDNVMFQLAKAELGEFSNDAFRVFWDNGDFIQCGSNELRPNSLNKIQFHRSDRVRQRVDQIIEKHR